MLNNTYKTLEAPWLFVAPYFIQTDGEGWIVAACEKSSDLLSKLPSSAGSEINITDIFSELCSEPPFADSPIGLSGFPSCFETRIDRGQRNPFVIRWTAAGVDLEPEGTLGWQLTGFEVERGVHSGSFQAKAQSSVIHKEKNLSDSIINSLPGIFYLFNTQGKFLRWNKLFESVSGYSGQEIMHMRPSDFFADEEKLYVQSQIQKAFDEGSSDAEATLITRQGERIPHYFTGKMILYQDEPCLIGTGLDISERKKNEERIKRSNERYALVTRATNDAIWDLDIVRGAPFWGEGIYTHFGYKPEPGTIVSGFWESHIHPLDRPRVIKSMELFIAQKARGVWSEEYRFQKADGQYATVVDRGFLVFDPQQTVVRVVGSMQDVTEKKELEKKLLQHELNKQKAVAQAILNAQENERAEIGRELHDNVNQILSTGKLYLELYRSNNPDSSSLIELCAENINLAIQEIRNISRALVPASLGDLGLADSIHDLVEDIRVSQSMEAEFHATDWFDEKLSKHFKLMLFRIIEEQVNNVVKHSGAKSLVVELVMKHPQRLIEVKISDDGKGYDPEKTKRGVGLSNIVSRADLFGGHVFIETSPGKGCELVVQIPFENQ
jgi:PAS domain S-box-containing protein